MSKPQFSPRPVQRPPRIAWRYRVDQPLQWDHQAHRPRMRSTIHETSAGHFAAITSPTGSILLSSLQHISAESSTCFDATPSLRLREFTKRSCSQVYAIIGREGVKNHSMSDRISRPLRVCFATERYPPQPGGVAASAGRVVGYLTAAGFDVCVVHPVESDIVAPRVVRERSDGAEVVRICYRQWDEESAVATVRAIILDHRAHPFDIFHGFFLTAVKNCTFANEYCSAALGSRPVIASMRGSDAIDYIFFPYWRDAIKEGLQAATWITSVNQSYLDHVGRELNLDIEGRSSVIRNGVMSVPEWDRWRLSATNRGVVGTVGAFRAVKDIPLLVRGYAGLPKSVRKGLLLAGYFESDDAQEESWSRTLIEEFGIGDEVTLTGRFSSLEVGTQLRAMHVYAQTSAYEGLPNALLEAAAHGVPLVATAVGGVEEILTHGGNGLLVPHGEPAALTAALDRVLTSDSLAHQLSHGARRLASELSQDHERDQWLTLYRSLT